MISAVALVSRFAKLPISSRVLNDAAIVPAVAAPILGTASLSWGGEQEEEKEDEEEESSKVHSGLKLGDFGQTVNSSTWISTFYRPLLSLEQ